MRVDGTVEDLEARRPRSVTIDTVNGTMTGILNVAAYMYRFADGAPFNGGAQDRISNSATMTVNLTGTFPPAGGGACIGFTLPAGDGTGLQPTSS